MSKTFTATFEGQSYNVALGEGSEIVVNGRQYKFDLSRIEEGRYSLIIDGNVYPVQLHQQTRSTTGSDELGSTVCLSIKGKEYVVVIDDERSTLLKTLLKTHSSSSSVTAIRAPMPGLIVKVEVEVGQEIKPGQGLVILEAMKMENEIKAIQAGKIQAVHVTPRKTVEKGEILISLLQE